MIQIVKGDLLESRAEALVNTVNTEGVMGKGLALQFKEKYPENYRLYKVACKKGEVQVGKMFITTDCRLDGSKIIINFPTKTSWRRPSEYSYIEDGLKSLRDEIIFREIRSIAIPPLGAHNGGLDWSKVKALIVNSLADIDCDIMLYEPSDIIIDRLKSERVGLSPARAMMLDVLCDMKAYDEIASIFAAEKATYFLQRMGAQNAFKIQFTQYKYGPYSRGKVAHVLYHLNGSYIKGMSGMEAKAFDPIWLLPDTPSLVSAYLDKPDNAEFKEICKRTKSFLRGYYSSASLEMLATLDYILYNDHQYEHWNERAFDDILPSIKESLHEWSERKELLFKDDHNIRAVLEHLRTLYT